MLNIHQPYIKKKKIKYFLALASMGVLLLGSLAIIYNSSTSISVYAEGDSRTIHDIENMQDITQQICSNTEENDVATLIDKRANVPDTSYKVVKLKDGNCWMQENLRLGGTSTISLTPDDTNITSNYTLPAGTTNGSWSANNTSQQIRIGNTSWNSKWQSSWGNYYSWCAATAGTCSQTAADNTNVSGSICPKGWSLPSGGSTSATSGGVGTDSEFYKLLNGLDMPTITASPYLFPAAGQIYDTNGSLVAAGISGFYWSRTFRSNSDAYYLYFDSSRFLPGTDYYGHHIGNSVRCVALGGLDKIEKPIWEESAEGNVNVNVPSILTIDAVSGMEEIAEASKIIEGTATATISSNTEYSVTLHSTQPSLRDISSSSDNNTNTAEISPVSSTNPVQPGNNSWGLWNGTSDPKTYTLPITTTPTEFPNTTSSSITTNGPTTTHTYYVGISISPSLPSGTYGTDVTITASVK